MQVVHVAFHLAIDRIFGAIFTSTVLPALALMTKLPGRNHVFPFNTAGAVFVFPHFIAAGFEVNDPFFALPVNFTAAVEIAGRIGINFYTSGFRLGETVDTFGECRARECSGQ
ncbi:hypothetical protein D3C73_1396000 [compost metagenome]